MDQKFFHSVRLDKEKCKGCTNCLKRCPTEAIRVRGGRAHIINERCIDCGECIRVCDYHAKYAQTDPLASINRFKYKIALPAPSLYGQFKHLISASQVLEGLLKMGFDDVFEVQRERTSSPAPSVSACGAWGATATPSSRRRARPSYV